MPCAGCEARKETIRVLEERVRFLESALNPTAGIVAQGGNPGLPVPQAPVVDGEGNQCDVVDSRGQGWVMTPDGMRPVQEAKRVREKLEEMLGGPR